MLANIKENRFAVPGLFILNILSFPASLIVVYTVYHIKTAAINLVPFDQKNSLKDKKTPPLNIKQFFTFQSLEI